MRLRIRVLLSALLLCAAAGAQRNAPVNGPAEKPVTIAFIHATVHPSPGKVLVDATVLVRDGRIQRIGSNGTIPPDAVVHDLHGLHLWPGLVDPYSDLGMPDDRSDAQGKPVGARFWNPAIKASTRAAELYAPAEDKARALRAQGFGAVVTHRMDGIARGTSCAVLLADRTPNEDIILPDAAAQFSFKKGTSKDAYPSSLMGAIALLRQVLYDARWYAAQGHGEQTDPDLSALRTDLDLPLVFEASDRNDVLRIADIGRGSGYRFIVKGAGDEYARLGDIMATDQPLILPLVMPEAYDVEDPFEAMEVSIAKLKHSGVTLFGATPAVAVLYTNKEVAGPTTGAARFVAVRATRGMSTPRWALAGSAPPSMSSSALAAGAEPLTLMPMFWA